jgi:hypothetical protein
LCLTAFNNGRKHAAFVACTTRRAAQQHSGDSA